MENDLSFRTARSVFKFFHGLLRWSNRNMSFPCIKPRGLEGNPGHCAILFSKAENIDPSKYKRKGRAQRHDGGKEQHIFEAMDKIL